MNILSVHRQKLIEAIENLPSEALPELANFIDYLRYKSTRTVPAPELNTQENPGSTFLLSIAGIGNSSESDVSERDEEILANEVDPIHGWSLKPDNYSTSRCYEVQ